MRKLLRPARPRSKIDKSVDWGAHAAGAPVGPLAERVSAPNAAQTSFFVLEPVHRDPRVFGQRPKAARGPPQKLRFFVTNDEMDHAVRRGNEEAVKILA